MTRSILSNPSSISQAQRGFSLVEMAVVMVVLGMILGGILMPLSTQRDLGNLRESRRQLTEIHDALLGFAALNGRLPCPATLASNGLADPNTATTNCTQEHGFIPGRTLGLDGSYDVTTNLLQDPWNNPIRYSLSSVSTWAYANVIDSATPVGNYRICRVNACPGGSIIAENIVAVILSRGKNGAINPTSPLQVENADNDTDFVKTTFSETVGAEFDDIPRWISPNILTIELLRAGNFQ